MKLFFSRFSRSFSPRSHANHVVILEPAAQPVRPLRPTEGTFCCPSIPCLNGKGGCAVPHMQRVGLVGLPKSFFRDSSESSKGAWNYA